MPYQICLHSDCGSTSQPSLFTRQDPCAGQPYSFWSGYLYYENTFAAAQVQFSVAGDNCYLCLVSPELGVTGSEDASRVLLTWDIQQLWSPHCQACNSEFYPDQKVQWTVPVYGGYCAVTASPVASTSLTPEMPCDGCDSPCQPEGEFYVEHDLDYRRAISCAVCLGCDCVTTNACITVHQDGQVIEYGIFPICNFSWTTALGTQIGINPATDGTCELTLSNVGGTTNFPAGQLPATSSIAGTCPDIQATWNFVTTVDTIAGPIPSSITVTITSAECGVCEALSSPPSCSEPLPRLLYATIDGSPCSCSSLSIPIYEDTLTGDSTWVGQSDPDAFCSLNSGCQVFIKLSCPGTDTGWILQLRYSTDGPDYQTYTYQSGSCAPMSLVFYGIDGAGKGDCLCEPPYYPKCSNFTVTISE